MCYFGHRLAGAVAPAESARSRRCPAPLGGACRPQPRALGRAAPPTPAPARLVLVAASRGPGSGPLPGGGSGGGSGAGRPVCSGSAEPAHSTPRRARRPRGEERRRRRREGRARCCEAGGSAERPCAEAAAEDVPPCAVLRAGLAILLRSGGTRLGFPPVMSPGQRGKATHSRAAAEA